MLVSSLQYIFNIFAKTFRRYDMKRLMIAFIVLFCVCFTACNFRNQLPPDGSRVVTINNHTNKIDYWLGSQPDAADKDSYHLYIKADSIAGFEKTFKSVLPTTSLQAKDVQMVVLFSNTIFSDEKITVAPENTLGAQVYYFEEEYLKTDVFQFQNNQNLKIEALNSFVDQFSTRNIYETSQIFKSPQNSVFIFANLDSKKEYEKGKSNYDKNLADYKLQN
jgi:hypothetical protein